MRCKEGMFARPGGLRAKWAEVMGSDPKVAIIGGGSAGWMSAAFLARMLPEELRRDVSIVLVEASDIPTVGVGEATTPSLRTTLAAIGADEFDFMRACDATFKHGIRFVQWNKAPHQAPGESYFHPFQAPLRIGAGHVARHWQALPPDERGAFAQAVGTQAEAALRHLAPKHQAHGSFEGPLSYAYHLDAGKLAVYLKGIALAHGVQHRIGKIVQVMRGEEDRITAIALDDGSTLEADFYIDCTGFGARLINADGGNSFVDKKDILFCDKALAARVPLQNGYEEIRPYTTSTAQAAGWIWDITLHARRGTGYVYSSRHASDEEAAQTLAGYLGTTADRLDMRGFDMRVGYQQQQWRGNCAAIGLSAGFIEPLESTGIYLVEMALWLLAQSMARYFAGVEVQSRFNALMTRHFENIIDFVKAHYCLSQRRDTPFWIDNRDPHSIPSSLARLLELWRLDVPNDYDFDSHILCFNSDNYQYILYGMAEAPQQHAPVPAKSREVMAQLAAKRNEQLKRLARSLKPNAEVIRSITQSPAHKPPQVPRPPMIGNIPVRSNYRLV